MGLDHVISVMTASRQYPGEIQNGDAVQLDRSIDTWRIALIDGLGHGPDAFRAAAVARDALAEKPDLGPVESLRRCHEALRGTRGAAIAIASIDAGACRLTSAGIGNVDVVIRQNGRTRRILADRGIVGSTLPPIHPAELDLLPDWLIVLHTDGVSAHFDLDAIVSALDGRFHPLADHILSRWGRDHDDATVVVAWPSASVAV